MPAAVSNVQERVRKDLKTCEGGYVELKRMTFGQVVQRRSMMKLQVESNKGSKNLAGELAMADAKITLFEFDHCIVDHNLEDETGRPLNLGQKTDFDRLDPRIGQEIESYIGEMNNFDEEDDPDLGN